MSGFDPDKYLAEPDTAAFDPDAYLAEGQAPAPAPEVPVDRPAADVSASGVGQAFKEALPMIGGVLGGAVGTLAGPVGSIAGAGGGYALGKASQNLIDQYLLDKPVEAKGVVGKLGETVQDIGKGAALQTAGMALGPAVQAVSKTAPFTELATKVGNPVADFIGGLMPTRVVDKAVTGIGKAVVDSNVPIYADKGFQAVTGIASSVMEKLPQSYQTILFNAAKENPRKAAVTHFLLMQQDPAYQQAVQDAGQPK